MCDFSHAWHQHFEHQHLIQYIKALPFWKQASDQQSHLGHQNTHMQCSFRRQHHTSIAPKRSHQHPIEQLINMSSAYHIHYTCVIIYVYPIEFLLVRGTATTWVVQLQKHCTHRGAKRRGAVQFHAFLSNDPSNQWPLRFGQILSKWFISSWASCWF